MNSGMMLFSARATIPAMKTGASRRRRLATLSGIKFSRFLRGAAEYDFSFLVFGSIGAPNLGALILLLILQGD